MSRTQRRPVFTGGLQSRGGLGGVPPRPARIESYSALAAARSKLEVTQHIHPYIHPSLHSSIIPSEARRIGTSFFRLIFSRLFGPSCSSAAVRYSEARILIMPATPTPDNMEAFMSWDPENSEDKARTQLKNKAIVFLRGC